MPPLGSTASYLLPSHDLFSLIVAPSLAALAIGFPLLFAMVWGAQRLIAPQIVLALAVVGVSFLTLIAIKGVANAAGYDWQDGLYKIGGDLLSSQRNFKAILFVGVLALVWMMRKSILKISRVLNSLGYAFGILAIFRLVLLSHGSSAYTAQAAGVAALPRQVLADSARRGTKTPIPGALSRRVVWVIFDETDFLRLFGDAAAAHSGLPNFDRMARESVFATNANSPASDTLYSIPALLTGTPIGGKGVRIDSSGSLSLERLDGTFMPLDERTSIFGALKSEGLTSSVLGFYQPYCRLFMLQRCDSFAWPQVGGIDSAIWANIPGVISHEAGQRNYWGGITSSSLDLLPQYLARNDALTFVHLNVPHLPASYADEIFNVRASTNPLTEYSHNLRLADRILGDIVHELESHAANRDQLLVFTTDHWLRKLWFQSSGREQSRPVLFGAWKVGDRNGIVLSDPISTVNTAAMILDFLNGTVSTQSDIANWWKSRPFQPSYIAPKS